MQCRILLATTTWWPQAARLAVALRDAGASVGAVCPDGSPLTTVRGLYSISRYEAFAPARSLAGALHAMQPDLVVPCDERAVGDLHALHDAEPADDRIRDLIERSLGRPSDFPSTLSRIACLRLAAAGNIRVPETRLLQSPADVRAWCASRPLPGLMKTDGSWGGAGVALVASEGSALAAFRRMSRPLATWRAAKFLLSNRDPYPAAEWLRRETSAVTGQDFVQGSAANIMVACWQGEVLATIGTKVLSSAKRFGAATIVRMVRHEEMEAAARHVVAGLGLSGFCGLDFIIDHRDDAHLIELNPRPTQLGHLPIATGHSLASVLLHRMAGQPPPAGAPAPMGHDTVALFPQAWLSEAAAPWLQTAYHDIPWTEPALVAELRRRPWERRSPLARLTDLLLRRPDPARQLEASLLNSAPADTFAQLA